MAVLTRLFQIRSTKKDSLSHGHGVGVVGVETVVPETRRKSNGQLFSPEAVRAQKFRERARSTTIGRPEFKLKYKHDIYNSRAKKTPNFQDFDEFQKQISRKYSEDLTSNTPSVPDDIEYGRGGHRRSSFEEFGEPIKLYTTLETTPQITEGDERLCADV
jgi:hypothetical protein